MTKGQSTLAKTEQSPESCWRTPQWLVERIRSVLGGIDLDPCTSADNPVEAQGFIAPPDDGILTPWFPDFPLELFKLLESLTESISIPNHVVWQAGPAPYAPLVCSCELKGQKGLLSLDPQIREKNGQHIDRVSHREVPSPGNTFVELARHLVENRPYTEGALKVLDGWFVDHLDFADESIVNGSSTPLFVRHNPLNIYTPLTVKKSGTVSGSCLFHGEMIPLLRRTIKDMTPSVYCNPPYGSTIAKWIEKCIQVSSFARVIILAPSRSDSRWFHAAWKNSKSRLLFRGRINFGADPAPFPSILFGFNVDLSPLSDLGIIA